MEHGVHEVAYGLSLYLLSAHLIKISYARLYAEPTTQLANSTNEAVIALKNELFIIL
jgi:hypothetical protein